MKETAAPKSPLLIVAWQLGLLLLAIYYTFIGGQTAQGIYDAHWRLITLWLTSLLLAIWLLGRLVSHAKIPRTPLDFPLLFLLLAWELATVFSVNPVYSQETLVFFIIYLFFFYLAADLGRWPWLTELAFNAVIAVSGLVWALGLWQLLHWYQEQAALPAALQSIGGWPRLSVLGNPNTLAGYITLILPIAVYKIGAARLPVTRLLLGLWIAMLGVVGLLSQSRGGVVGLVVAVGFYSGIWVWQRAKMSGANQPVVSKFSRWGAIALGLAALAGGLFWLVAARGLEQGVDVRQQVSAGAVQTLLKHPLVGAGPGALGEELLRYQQPLNTIWADAHNLFLTFIAETGLVGLVGLVWLVGVSLTLLWTTLRHIDPAQWRMSSWAGAAALLGFAAHNLVDSLFKFPLIMVLVAVWAGFWVSSYLVLSPRRVWTYPLTAAALAILLVNTLIGIRGIRNIEVYQQAVNAAEAGNWSQALTDIQLVDRLAPHMPFYQRQLGFVAGYLAGQNPAYRAKAITAYQSALKSVDTLAVDHANLACLLWQNGQQAEARQEMETARQLEPEQSLYRLNLGYYLEMMGEYPAAFNEYASALAYQPDAAQSDYWHQNEWRTAALAEILAKTDPPSAQNAPNIIEGDAFYQAAQAAATAGDNPTAFRYYESAFRSTLPPIDPNLSRYATEVARRRPLPLNYLPCLIQLYPTQRLVEITLAQGDLLERQGYYLEAARVYRRLLTIISTGAEVNAGASIPPEYESQIRPIVVKLNKLCQMRPEICPD